AAWLTSKSSLRFNLITGKEKTYQAWYGVPENLLASDRTYNPAGTEKPGAPYDNQTDNYRQTHYQLFFNHAFNARWSLNTAVFLTRGIGYYEEYKAAQNFSDYGLPDITQGNTTITQTDLVRRRWLDNYFYGQIASLQYKDNRNEWTLGGGWNVYDGKHYGTIPWVLTGTTPPANYRYYDYPAVKTDINLYSKWQRQLGNHWTGFADLQYRYVSHTMTGFEGNPSLDISRQFHFINPKLGFNYQHNDWKWYLSYALGHKEPNRDDFQASLASQPKAETLHDIETGFERKGNHYKFGATFYYMYYYNQLVLTGQINDVGSYTRINIPDSYRLGLELEGTYTPVTWMRFSGNLSLSRNKIASFTEYIDNYDNGGQNAVPHHNTDISFSPSVVGSATFGFFPLKQLELDILNKYVGKEYMDNSQQETRRLNAFFVTHLRAAYTLPHFLGGEWTLRAQVNNLFNTRYEPNGYTYVYIANNILNTENSYYPMAGTNFLAAISLRF
ncbi:MAG TPA: TonB-dependent receptor, partial [Sediminibacterium sp.]|nr:TonB-dependent receptor [Sediminibacterium sp.]